MVPGQYCSYLLLVAVDYGLLLGADPDVAGAVRNVHTNPIMKIRVRERVPAHQLRAEAHGPFRRGTERGRRALGAVLVVLAEATAFQPDDHLVGVGARAGRMKEAARTAVEAARAGRCGLSPSSMCPNFQCTGPRPSN